MTRRIASETRSSVLFVSVAVCILLLDVSPTRAGDQDSLQFDVTIHAGKLNRDHSPVCVSLELPAAFAKAGVRLQDVEGLEIAAQITEPGLVATSKHSSHPPEISAKITDATTDRISRELHFTLGHLAADGVARLHGTLSVAAPKTEKSNASGPQGDVFQWHDFSADHHFLLSYGERKVLDYVAPQLDDSTPKLREQTYKPFHQMYDATGTRIVTKPAGGSDTHHRGLFYGFNQISYDHGRKHADTWQCLKDAYESHESILASAAGPVLGRHRVAIDWHGEGKQVFAHEERELTAYAVPGGTLVDFVSLLRAADGPVHLEGDPHHSGFHFRAADEVASKTKKQTYYLRPDGVGKLDQTINWDSTPQDPRTSNQPWKGMCFVLGGERYTAAILDRPDNPKPAHWSERDYGRFGSTFVDDVTTERPLLVRYRVWLQTGEATPERLAGLGADFVEPVVADLQLR